MAKRTTHDARLAQQQAEHYVTEITPHQSFAPFAFLSNGVETYFWDVGNAAKRLVAGFFSPDDLERLHFIRQNKIPLSQATINNRITDRAYLMFEGSILKAGTAEELAADEMVRKVYLGKNFELRRKVMEL